MRRAALVLVAIERLLLVARRPLVWTLPVRTARAQSLDGHAAADRMSGAQALQDAAVARGFARRNLKGHGAHAAARLARQSEGAGALGQRAQPAALAVEHFDLADMAIGIRVELDPGLGRADGSRAAGRDFDHAGRAANAERGAWGGDFHVPGLGNEARDKRRRTDREVEGRGIASAACLINERVHHDARISRQAERGLIVERDAERGIGPGHQRVVLENRIVDAERRDLSGIAAGDCRIALQRRHLTDFAGRLIGRSGRRRILRGRRRILRARGKRPKHRGRRCADCSQLLDEVAPFQIGL